MIMNAQEKFMLERRSYIGGSDMAAIYGVSPFTTAVELWLQKTGQRRAHRRSKAEQRILDSGKRLEPIIVDITVEKLRDEGQALALIGKNKRYEESKHTFLYSAFTFVITLAGEKNESAGLSEREC